jgi:hypothetical protein
MPIGSIKHAGPTNIINSVKGWNIRHIYNYYGTTNTTDFNYYTQSGEDYTQNLFNMITDYGNSLSPSPLTLYKGGYTFPPRYFRAGKDLRIKAFLYVSTGVFNDAFLQINTGINNTKLSYVTIGSSNKGAIHELGRRSAYLEIEIVCRGIEAQNKPSTLNMMATGYIKYDEISTINDVNCLIPIVPLTNTLATVDNDLGSPVENILNLNFDGSFHIPTINVLNLSIEELE